MSHDFKDNHPSINHLGDVLLVFVMTDQLFSRCSLSHGVAVL